MHEAPTHVSDAQVLEAVRSAWDREVDGVQHLAVGFGAHHWAASVGGARTLFVTLDALTHRHDRESLSAAYRSAAALDLPFVHRCLEPWTVPLADGALSVTRWLDGSRPEVLDVDATSALLELLHAAPPSASMPRWRPVVGPDLADRLRRRVATPWSSGPYAEQARVAITEHLDDLDAWVASYHRLAAAAVDRPWVPTHGEPGTHNQLLTADGLRLVDWESFKLAPAERDLRTLGTGDPAMLEMFDLEWRLDEVAQYAAWFEAPHTGSASDVEALGGLLEELAR